MSNRKEPGAAPGATIWAEKIVKLDNFDVYLSLKLGVTGYVAADNTAGSYYQLELAASQRVDATMGTRITLFGGSSRETKADLRKLAAAFTQLADKLK